MSSGKKLLAIVGVGALALSVATVAFGAYVVQRAGTIRLTVHEKGEGGSDVAIRLPAVVLHGALALVPDGSIRGFDADLREAAPLLGAVLRGIESRPDAVYLDVKSGPETVRIAKRDGVLAIDVDAPDATVRIEVPLRSLRTIADRVERAIARGQG